MGNVIDWRVFWLMLASLKIRRSVVGMECKKQYIISEHIRYEINGEMGKRVLIIPNIDGVPDLKKVLCLSATALDIWRMIVDGKNYNQIIDEMSQRYFRKREEIEGDIKGFLGNLLDKCYISIAE